MKCGNQDKNVKNCTCTYISCNKRGMCCECVAYHRQNGEIPGCFFPPEAERSYDRSIKNFINAWSRR
ncbi:MAG: DUF6485 family protein [Candidatus Omnitrophica bacterium]|nr:DUF6485 family protein [Candidatus Omnitrophota bacterium]MCM8816638.1 DUF6485 family protein [Candidatus Omnitrophota bacterium]